MKSRHPLNFHETAFRAEIAFHVLPSVISRLENRDIEYAVYDAFDVADSFIDQLKYTRDRDAKLDAEVRAEVKLAKKLAAQKKKAQS
jgi:hypothetical protein